MKGTQRRAAIYARYSSDLQSAASIEDQVRLCRALCADRGWTVVEVFADEAMSGASSQRPGFRAMQGCAAEGGFEVLVAESLDRLSRDQEHIAGLHKRMTYFGIDIFTKSEGLISEMHVGLGGTMSALFLRQLGEKTHRGLEGRVKAGKSAGGRSYGYRPYRVPREDGTIPRGELEIDPREAAVVRRIFAEYDSGLSARAIAMGLNRDGIPSPRSGRGSGSWSFSTIQGNWRRGTGILNNRLYIGQRVWNRQGFVSNPETDNRVGRPKPEGAWIFADVPHLRIIDAELWDRVKERQGAIRRDVLEKRSEGRVSGSGAPGAERGRRAGYLFSGLLYCGCCGSTYIMISDTRYGCAAARNKGTCENRKTITRAAVESRVLDGLRGGLLHPELIEAFMAAWKEEMVRAEERTVAAQAGDVARLAKVKKEISGLLTAILDGMYHPSLKAKMDELEGEKAALEARLASGTTPGVPTLDPALAETYAAKVAALSEALNAPALRQEAAEVLRGLVERVTLVPDAGAPNGHAIELVGELGALLSLFGGEGGANANARRGAAGVRQVAMVAGAGFEPAAFRL